MKYADVSTKFKEILGLRWSPVAVKLVKRGEAIPTSIPEPDLNLRYCQALTEAKKGRVLLLLAKKHACPVGASSLGLMEAPPKVKSGEFHYKLGGFASIDAAKNMIAQRPELEAGSITATIVAPLEATPIDPDVVVVTGLPEQIYWILAASIFTAGGRISINTSPFQATCADATLIPYMTGKVNLSLGCIGCRKYANLGNEEVVVGIPIGQLEDIAVALQRLSEKIIPFGREKVP